MLIDEARGRIIAFVAITIKPLKYAPMRSWYQQQSEAAVSVRLHTVDSRSDDPWRELEIHLDADRLWWTHSGTCRGWSRVACRPIQTGWTEGSRRPIQRWIPLTKAPDPL